MGQVGGERERERGETERRDRERERERERNGNLKYCSSVPFLMSSSSSSSLMNNQFNRSIKQTNNQTKTILSLFSRTKEGKKASEISISLFPIAIATRRYMRVLGSCRYRLWEWAEDYCIYCVLHYCG